MPEETKPVERGTFERWAASKAISADTSGYSFAQASWDAALERAAQLEPNEAMVPQDADSAHIYRVGFADCLNAIRALKGSR